MENRWLSNYRSVIPRVVFQHVEDAASLRQTRRILLKAPHVKLSHLLRVDERIAANLDGILIAGDFGERACYSNLENGGVGEVFVATVKSIQAKNVANIEKLLALAEAAPDALPGLVSAFGWVPAECLSDIVKKLLCSENPLYRLVGIITCSMHQISPGAALKTGLADSDCSLRACSLRIVGESGMRVALGACVNALKDKDDRCRFWAARSAALLGEKSNAVDVLNRFSLQPGPLRGQALQIGMKLGELQQGKIQLEIVARNRSDIRLLIRAAGTAGNAQYVPWLISQTANPDLTRLAGESFSFITGLDLAYVNLDRKSPENFESGPNDDPDDEDVAMDEDDGLPWPDPVKIQAWWNANKHRFQPGVRYFMGEPPSVLHCRKILREGYQRQRIAAAEYLCLLQPGTKLFPTSAPAWRQERWLRQMG